MILVILITAYRLLPGFMRKTCPRAGASCSELALAAAYNGGGFREVRSIVANCTPSMGRHEPTCDFPG